jgi:hypothetical protein
MTAARDDIIGGPTWQISFNIMCLRNRRYGVKSRITPIVENASSDHLVGEGEDRWWHGEAKRASSLEVNH